MNVRVLGAGAVTSNKAVSVNLNEFNVLPAVQGAPAGKVTFTVKNSGKIEHEFVVLRTLRPAGGLMDKSGKAANKGGMYWLVESDKVAFDDSKFVAGDEIASIMVAPFAGDRGEIAYAANYKDGKYTGELSRKLVTGSKFDVQFDKLGGAYSFGFAAFDNAQVRHAIHGGPLQLKFAK